MELAGQLLSDNPLFVILTCHAPEHFSAQDLVQILERLSPFRHTDVQALKLQIPSEHGNALVSSFGARIGFGDAS